MKEITIKAYEFDELSDKAKEKARVWFRQTSEGDDYWTESIYDEAIEQGSHMGIEIKINERSWVNHKTGKSGVTKEPCIFWRGFWSQGDGACFEGAWSAGDVKASEVADGWGEDSSTTEIKRIAAEFAKVAEKYPYASFMVKHSGHYYHKYCTDFDFEPNDDTSDDWTDVKWAEFDAACVELKEAARDFMDWIYRQLEKEYEYQNSDEQVDESIRANEYLFTDQGSRRCVL